MSPLFFLGFGDAARAVLRAAPGRTAHATTRNAARAAELRDAGAQPLVLGTDDDARLEALSKDADVVVTFPPDGKADAQLAPRMSSARALVYVSSTAVYGTSVRQVDEHTEAHPDSPRGEARLRAEETWRAAGAVILRAPALYGGGTGLHVRLQAGTYRLPGDGSGVVSRVHLDDLARFVLGALAHGARGAVHVIGDREPATQREIVSWLTERMGLPFPPSVPLAEAPETLRGSRSIDASHALRELGVTLAYPTFREGYAAVLDEAKG